MYGLLERNGIPKGEISNRFDDTVTVLTRALGSSSRVRVHRTAVEVFRLYSQRAEFSYQDSLRDRLIVLKETVVASHLIPKSRHDGIDFDSGKEQELRGREILATTTVSHDSSWTRRSKASRRLDASIMSRRCIL